jgi:hypothetical protein
MIRSVLRMGDPRLWQKARLVEQFNTPQLHALIIDLQETMRHLDGAGLAAPQIGVGLRVVIFGVDGNPRYPDAEQVPRTVLINPVLTPLAPTIEEAGKAASRFPVCAAGCRAGASYVIPVSTLSVGRSTAASLVSMRAWCNTNATTSTAFSIRCGSGTSAASVSSKSFFLVVAAVRSNSQA